MPPLSRPSLLAVAPIELPFAATAVSADWLASHEHRLDVRVVDVRTDEQLPTAHPLRRSAFDKGHVPAAIYLGDVEVPLPHDIGSALIFASTMSQRGVGDEHVIVVCGDGQKDRDERVLWALRSMGHPSSFLLEGGLPAWSRRRLPVAVDAVAHAPASFTAKLIPAPADTDTRLSKRRRNKR